MSAIQACLLVVPAKATGTGVQTVMGVQDIHGTAFVGKVFLIIGNATLNTVEQWFRWHMGWSDVTHNTAECTDEKFTFNAKILCGGTSGNYSVLDLESFITLGGVWKRQAYISDSRSGEFDITYDLNDLTGDSYIIVALGGDDLVSSMGDLNPTTLAIGFEAIALFLRRQTFILGSGSQKASGGMFLNLGWAVNGGTTQEVAAGQVVYQAGNGRFTNTTECYADVSSNLGVVSVTNARSVSAWTSSAVTITGAAQDSIGYLALGGIDAAAGVLTQPTTTGPQEIVTGLDNAIVFLQSVGLPADNTLNTTQAEWSLGVLMNDSQAVMWGAESVTGNSTPLLGVRYLSNQAAVVSGTANGTSTTFVARANSGGFDSTAQSFTLNWTAVDATQRKVLWLALGPAGSAPPPPPVGSHAIRRARAFMIPDNLQQWVFFRSLQIYLETGIGNVQAADPVMNLRWSDDAGHTWTDYHQVSAGTAGQFSLRAIWRRLGKARNRVFEVMVDDPVAWSLLQAYMEIDPGTS